MPLRFYADECVNGDLISGLRHRRIDVRTAADEGLVSAADPEQFDRAIALGRTMLTADQDFLALAASFLRADKAFPGLAFVVSKTTVGSALRSIVLLAETTSPEAMADRVEWIS